MSAVLDWLDQRTGLRQITRAALFENIPGGARWRYVWGSTVVFALGVQFLTGVFLWMGYSPSAQTAWESVFYLQEQTTGGWLLRGLHHYTAQVLPVLLVLHLLQVVVDGAYKAPREVNFWFGVVLAHLVLALSLTGYLLPWDQTGFWATRVSTNITGVVPVLGPAIQKLLVGGPDYGHLTLTRFFALHAGVLPATLVVLTVGHIYLFRRHGITAKEPRRRPDAAFWPDQVLRDAVACLAVLGAVLFLIVRHRLFSGHGPLGAELGAPANPAEPFDAARPEWYFLFLFQFLKLFPSGGEIWGAVIIPGLVIGVVFLMPLLGRWRLGHRFNVALAGALVAAAALLTYLAWDGDRRNPDYQRAVAAAERDAARVKTLALSPARIPVGGALELLRSDPLTQGPKLFADQCAACHRYAGTDGLGRRPAPAQAASDLQGFGSREWLALLLAPQGVASTNRFGATKLRGGKMVKFVTEKVAHYSPERMAALRKVIAAVSAEAQLKSQATADRRDAALIEEGRRLLRDETGCTDCHQFRQKDEDATAPDLTGYGSREWLIRFISDPAAPEFYGERNDRMPSFGRQQILTEQQIGLIADWLRGDWYEPAP